MSGTENSKGGPAGSLRRLGGDGQTHDLGSPDQNRAAQDILNDQPMRAALAALHQGNPDDRTVIRRMISAGIFTQVQYALIGSAVEAASQADLDGAVARAKGNDLLWDIINRSGGYRKRLLSLLVDVSKGMDYYT